MAYILAIIADLQSKREEEEATQEIINRPLLSVFHIFHFFPKIKREKNLESKIKGNFFHLT